MIYLLRPVIITTFPTFLYLKMTIMPPGFAAFARSKDHDDRVAIHEGCAPLLVFIFSQDLLLELRVKYLFMPSCEMSFPAAEGRHQGQALRVSSVVGHPVLYSY